MPLPDVAGLVSGGLECLAYGDLRERQFPDVLGLVEEAALFAADPICQVQSGGVFARH